MSGKDRGPVLLLASSEASTHFVSRCAHPRTPRIIPIADVETLRRNTMRKSRKFCQRGTNS